MNDDYIYCINSQISKFKILPKLSIKDIQKYEEPYKMCFYFFYGYYSMYKKYELVDLNRCINKKLKTNLFMLISNCGNIKEIKYLVSKGVDFHKCGYNKFNVYLIAVLLNNFRLMKYFESIGLNIHKKSFDGENAYCIAANGGNIKLMKHLEKKGVNIYSRNIYGENFFNMLNKILFTYDCKIKPYVLKNINYKLNRYKICFI